MAKGMAVNTTEVMAFICVDVFEYHEIGRGLSGGGSG